MANQLLFFCSFHVDVGSYAQEKTWKVWATCRRNLIHSECLDSAFSHVYVFWLLFFFFFLRAWTVTSHGFTVHALFGTVHALFCTVHALFTYKKILKMGPTILFTQLKIILLQCFQFSVFSFQFSATISSIQTDPKCTHSRVFWVNIVKSEVNLRYRNCSNLFGILRREIKFRYYCCRNSTKSMREKKKKVERENVKFRQWGYQISCAQFCCSGVWGVPEVKWKKKLTN